MARARPAALGARPPPPAGRGSRRRLAQARGTSVRSWGGEVVADRAVFLPATRWRPRHARARRPGRSPPPCRAQSCGQESVRGAPGRERGAATHWRALVAEGGRALLSDTSPPPPSASASPPHRRSNIPPRRPPHHPALLAACTSEAERAPPASRSDGRWGRIYAHTVATGAAAAAACAAAAEAGRPAVAGCRCRAARPWPPPCHFPPLASSVAGRGTAAAGGGRYCLRFGDRCRRGTG